MGVEQFAVQHPIVKTALEQTAIIVQVFVWILVDTNDLIYKLLVAGRFIYH